MRSRKRCATRGVQRFDWYPMIRGRLVAVNGKTVSPDDYPDERAKRLVDREFNLSNSAGAAAAQRGRRRAAGSPKSAARSAWKRASPRRWA